MTLTLTLTVAVLAFLCLLALLWSRWPAWVKGGLVLGVTMFYFLAHDIVHRLSGWPAADPMPPRFVLLAAVFDEPSAKSAGGLYVWVNAIEDGKPAREPRAYRLPYTKDLHAMLDEGLKKGRQGVTQMGTAEPKGDAKGFSWLRPGRDEQVIKIRDLPAPQLPEK